MTRRKKWMDQYKDYAPAKKLPHPRSVRFDDATLFTMENDHNPIVAELCNACRGCGSWSETDAAGHRYCVCEKCRGAGSIQKPTRLFHNDNPPLMVKANEFGWIKCPHCGKRFHPPDPNAWTGWRHLCGQRMTIENLATPS